ncbi:hypothetical protein DB30_00748 [Enhygromyxa salina]|uniref:Uncharacterized protein n=1 Tax=Enhygromyxa salina TaxID=215803 RepID=A0A0C2A4X6_9BACT|nr:hypothetical protein DB30_00748 [Enhygromyxa salina]
MICACAKVARVDCIVDLDGDFWKLAPRINIAVMAPEQFRPKQLSFGPSDDSAE